MPVYRQSASRCLFAFVLWVCALAGEAFAVDAANLRPGLVADYRDTAKPSPTRICQIDPIIALNLKAGQSPHPRLDPDHGTYEWKGYLNILRPGKYRFRAQVRGDLRLEIAGREALTASVTAPVAELRTSPELSLDAGTHTISARFQRGPGAARAELFWSGPHFDFEPLGYEPLGHLPSQEPGQLITDRVIEHGRLLVEEHGCVKCHQPDSSDKLARGLQARPAPDLSKAGERLHAGWIYRWLDDPQARRTTAVMPRLFSRDDIGKAERFFVAAYLASLGKPVQERRPPSPKDLRNRETRGEKLFTSLGCIACHGDAHDQNAPDKKRSFYTFPAPVPLFGLGSKTTPEALRRYLENPLAIDPSGRMPHMLLQGNEAQDLAAYLCRDRDSEIDIDLPALPTAEQMAAAFRRVDVRAEEWAAFQRLPVDRQRIDLGQRIVIAKACSQCHAIAPGGKPFAAVIASSSFTAIQKPERLTRGCLADAAPNSGAAPWFSLTKDDRQAVRQFLANGTHGTGAPAPAFEARVSLQRFRCLACHQRDGEGGLSPSIVENLRKTEKAENAEAISPPQLTGVGHKLRTSWLRQVLTQTGRARPWMSLRMPQFGTQNISHLAEGLAILEGAEPDDSVHAVPLTAATIQAGRTLAGKQGFGCISCHDFAHIPNSGTRGPDLVSMNQRVRYSWYRRWLEQAQRMTPGTRMPTIFNDGRSALAKVLDGSADAQAAAMWAYLSIGPGLPLPEGLEPPKGLIVQVGDKPVVLRTFMPDAGSRAIAVGFPKGISVAFDAATCRLAYAWSGNFLDATPVWANRGGAPAKVLGARFWSAPPGCPWAITDSNDPPDFVARAKDPAHGGSVPEGKLYTGPHYLHFLDYSLDADGAPIFDYRVSAGENQVFQVHEKPEPLQNPVATGIRRRFTLAIPAQQQCWLWAGQATSEPKLLGADGVSRPIGTQASSADIAASGTSLVLPQGGDRVTILSLADTPKNARWHIAKQSNDWTIMLRLPIAAHAESLGFSVLVLLPYRADPALLKEIAQKTNVLTAPSADRRKE